MPLSVARLARRVSLKLAESKRKASVPDALWMKVAPAIEMPDVATTLDGDVKVINPLLVRLSRPVPTLSMVIEPLIVPELVIDTALTPLELVMRSASVLRPEPRVAPGWTLTVRPETVPKLMPSGT